MKLISGLLFNLVILTTSVLSGPQKTETFRHSEYGIQGTATLFKPNFEHLLYESFENSVPPEGWLRLHLGNAKKKWSKSSSKARTGNYSAVIRYSTASEIMDEWLITPAIDLAAAPGAKLVFYEEISYWNYGKVHNILVSTTSQEDTSTFTVIKEMRPANHTSGGFDGNPVEVDLADFIGQDSVFIAFQYTGSDADDWFIDDVMVVSPSDHDVMVAEFSLERHYNPGKTISPQTIIQNVGLNPESFKVFFGYLDWDSSMVIIDSLSVDTLAVGDEFTAIFNNYTFGRDKDYTYFVSVECETDQDHSNDAVYQDVQTFTEEKQMVLVEKATGTWCQFCPGSAKAVDALYDEYPNSVAVLEYHAGDSYSNDMTLERISMYGMTGYPTAVFNGLEMIVGGATNDAEWSNLYNEYDVIYEDALYATTGFLLDLDAVFVGDTLKAFTEILYLADVQLHSYRLFYAINESHIAESWQGMDSLQFVARAMYPGPQGKPFYSQPVAPYEGLEVRDTLITTLPQNVSPENCQLIVFIQEMNSLEIAAVDRMQISRIPTGMASEQHNQVAAGFRLSTNFPNPFNPSTTFQFYSPGTASIKLEIFNTIGEKITELSNKVFSKGSHQVVWDGRNKNGVETPSGIYFLRASHEGETRMLKLVKLN